MNIITHQRNDVYPQMRGGLVCTKDGDGGESLAGEFRLDVFYPLFDTAVGLFNQVFASL